MNTKRTDTRQHILDCGQLLVASKGFVGVGLNEILSSAGVPKGSFYHYFASKEAFGGALLESYFETYLARIDVLFGNTAMSPAQRLIRYFERWIETQCSEDNAQKCLIVKLGSEVADLSEAMRTIMVRGVSAIVERLADCVAAGLADGSIRTVLSPHDCARCLYETWLGASLLAKLYRDRSTLDLALLNTQQALGLK